MKRPHRRPEPPHQRHEWILNDEREISLSDAAEQLAKIGQILGERKAVKLTASGNEIEVKPSDPCQWTLRYERMPHGELKLHIELEWDDNRQSNTATTNEPVTFS